MAGAFDRALIAMDRVKYAPHWPSYLRSEFITLRLDIFGWNSEPSAGGSPLKRYWKKAKGVADEMQACCNLDFQEIAGASLADGPDGNTAEHCAFGHVFSLDENVGPRPKAPPAPPSPLPR